MLIFMIIKKENYALEKGDQLYKPQKQKKFTKKIFGVFKNIKRNTKNAYLLQSIKSNSNIKIEYLELRNKNNLSPIFNKKNLKLFVCFYIKKVRLIDNF